MKGRRPLASRVVIGLVGGVLVGVFLGDLAGVFQFAADGFVKLFQMSVLPYITVSLTASIGSLRPDTLRTLGARIAATLGVLWAVALSFALLTPLTFPSRHSGAFFSAALLEPPPALNLVDLYIPANPFFALANNVVPGVVVFSIVVGIAMIGVPHKHVLLDVLATTSAVLARAMRFVTHLMPYGIFAIAAATAGSVRMDEAGRLQIYLLAYAALALLVGLWVLPGMVSALTPIPAREIFAATREALLTATIAGDLFIVLPLLISASKDLVARHIPDRHGAQVLPDLIVPIAYNFPHGGKLLSVSFILFAGWFSDSMVDVVDYPRLAAIALVTLFGSINVAVPFLLDVFRISADTFELFLASSVINSRLGSFVAAMHTIAIALLGTCAVTGAIRWRTRAILKYVAVTAVLTVGVLGGARLVAEGLLSESPSDAHVLDSMRLDLQVEAVVRQGETAVNGPHPVASRFDAITRRDTLRVCYLPDALPFAFFNRRGELVGLDIALMSHLARELDVTLEFVPAARSALDEPSGAPDRLRVGDCDVVIGGVAVTTTRARLMRLSSSYLSETLAFVVRDGERGRFASWDAIRLHDELTIVVPSVPYFMERLRQRLPHARLLTTATADAAFAALAAGANAVAMPAERGSAWTMRYPQYSVAVPMPELTKVPLAFALPIDEPELAAFIDTWIDLKRHDGTIDALYHYWILGRTAQPPAPRWSIIRDVLHWVE